jgi:signal transduction histidine kinase/ligand-binding sensor domain-containing protein/DNA-binding response OmpR family regulator
LGIGLGQQNDLRPQPLEEGLSFYLLDVESGLSNNFINGIEQDSLGFIWIATIAGLNKYDGTQFTNFRKDHRGQTSNLADNYVQQIKLDSKGKLFLATDGGLNIYDPKLEKFVVHKQEDGLLSNNVSCFAFGPDGQPIIGIYRGGIQFADKDWKMESFHHQPENIASLSSNEISSMAMQGDSILWIGTFDKGLNKMHMPTRSITRIPINNNGEFSTQTINALYTDYEGNLWMGSKNGLQVITVRGDTLKLNSSTHPGKGLSDGDVICFEEDHKGQLWIGTRNGGLNILDKGAFLSKKADFSIKWFLPRDDGSSVFNRTVSAIKMDKEGNMWLGTSTGLNFVNPQGEPIKCLQRNSANPETLGHDRIGALAENNKGKIWIGTDGGGLDLFDPKTGKFEHYVHRTENPHSLSNNYVIALHQDRKNRVWAGTYQGGLNKMDPGTSRWEHYLQGNIKDGSDVRTIFEDRKGQIWIGTNRGGLFRYIEKKNQFEYIESLGKIDIRDLRESPNGDLWMATFGSGIIKYDPNTGKATYYNGTSIKGIRTNSIFCILPLKNGDILAGTRYEGLLRLNPGTNTVLHFTEKDGLSNNTISSMVMENENDIWLGTFMGISHYNTKTHKIDNLDTYSKIQLGEFNIGAALKSSSGHLYFGGNKGLNIFDPKDLNDIQPLYPIVFENLKIFNTPISVSQNNKKGILRQSISYQDRLTLTHKQTLFSLDFAALKYPEARNIGYSYLLEGYQDHWVDTKNVGTANLSNIPPGNYTLKIKAKMGTGAELSQQLAITIVPPFWKTLPAYFIYLLLITAIIWGILKYYTDRIKLKNSLLVEKKQRQMEHDLNEERFRFFTSFSHELKSPLTLILAPVEDLMMEMRGKKQMDNLRFIKKNAKHLFQLINKLLEFRKSEFGLSRLTIGEYDLSSYMEQLILNYYPLSKKMNISLTHSLPGTGPTAWVDLEKIQIIMNNLISNAFKHCGEKGEIHISLAYDDDNFTFRVTDTGEGIDPRDLSHIFEWYYQSGTSAKKKGAGIGLALSKRFAELHMGKIKVESQLGAGSTFTLRIPRDKSLFSNAPLNKITFTDQKENEMVDLEVPVRQTLRLPTEKKRATIQLDEDREVILLIDDNLEILAYLKGLLQDRYDLLYAENGQEGMDKALQYVPDLIISDVMMPKKSGIDLCAALKKETSTTHIPIILLTAKDNLESIKTGYEEGADDYIAKPFNSQILCARIRNLLDSRKQLRKYFLDPDGTLLSLSKEHSGLWDREKEFLRRLEVVILEQLRQEKTDVDTITHSMGMSRTSLFRKIKAVTGQNINEHIRSVKVKKAAQLIKEENLTIAQASFEVGFNSVKYFRKLFKEQYGSLPSEIRYKNPTKTN